MKRMLASELEPLRPQLAAGKLAIVVSIGAGPAAADGVKARMDAIEARIHADLGPAARVERVVRPSRGSDAGAIDATAYAGIDRKDLAGLFAP